MRGISLRCPYLDTIKEVGLKGISLVYKLIIRGEYDGRFD